MMPDRLDRESLLNSLPTEWPDDLLPEIRRAVRTSGRKVVVLDDDPTGTQTVHDIPVLTEWPVESLCSELANDLPAFYLLTNSRSLPLTAAQALNQEIGRNLVAAAQQTGRDIAVVSRSDSTLRGHYPGEVDALAAALDENFDAQLIIPFFLEGGRYTVHDIHYVAEGDQLIPAAETPYAQDTVFGYTKSNLREWVAEKSGGRHSADQVAAISIRDIRIGGPQRMAEQLMALTPGSVCVVNAASYRDMEVFILGLLTAEASGQKFLYRTAASFVQVRAGLAPQPLLTRTDLALSSDGGGLFIVGSHVPKTTSQVNALLAHPETTGIELRVEALLDDGQQRDEIGRVVEAANTALADGADVVVYTSRKLVTGEDVEGNLSIGQRVSESIVAVVQAISTRPRYLLAKGGITASDVATQGLNIKRAMVAGQILPGVPVWRTGAESRHPGLAYIVFPGNVGDADSLVAILEALQ